MMKPQRPIIVVIAVIILLQLLLLLRNRNRTRPTTLILNTIRILLLFPQRHSTLSPLPTPLRINPIRNLPTSPAPNHVLPIQHLHSRKHPQTLFDTRKLVHTQPHIMR
jgi:hypothetical protein